MPIHALVSPANIIARRDGSVDPNVQTKAGWRWLPVETAGNGAVDPATQIKGGPVTTVEAARVLDTFTIRSKTAPELDADKDAAVGRLTDANLLKVLLSVVNDNRALRAKVNQVITDTGAATVKFPAGQVSVVDMTQLKTALKALLV